MPSSIATDLFAVMEKQMGAEAARAAAASYLANSQGSAVVEKAARPPMTDEHKAKLKAGREAALAKKAAAASEPPKAPSPAAPVEVKQRPPMTEEHKAKLKAGREAALAKKAAEKAAGAAASSDSEPPAPPSPAAEPSPQSDSSGPKKRGPKPLKDMTAEERAAHDAKVAERAAKKHAEKAAQQLLPASPSE